MISDRSNISGNKNKSHSSKAEFIIRVYPFLGYVGIKAYNSNAIANTNVAPPSHIDRTGKTEVTNKYF